MDVLDFIKRVRKLQIGNIQIQSGNREIYEEKKRWLAETNSEVS